jgi:hypothetical protein
METDVAHNLQNQEGSKNAASNGPDINKLAGDFSSGVKFSPKVKHMMEQSKIKIAAFINSMSPSATAAEDSLVEPAATPNAALTPCAMNAAGAGKCHAATLPAAVEVQAIFCDASAAGAGEPPAAMPRVSSATSSPSAAPIAAEAAVKTKTHATSATIEAAADSDMVGSRTTGAVQATPTKNSFRVSTESSGAFL